METRRIKFNPVNHSYTDHLDNKYNSVTRILGNYKEPFNKEYWSRVKAKQAGVSVKTIVNKWEKITKDAINKGNNKHDYLEDRVNLFSGITRTEVTGSYITTISDILSIPNYGQLNTNELFISDLQIRYPSIYNVLCFYLNKGYKLYPEIAVYDFKYLICGRIDLLLIKDNDFIILDWKTNKRPIVFEAGYYKKDADGNETDTWIRTGKLLKEPISHLQDCSGYLYSMQVSIYASLVELWGLNCKLLSICHIRDNTINNTVCENVHFHKIDYYKKEANDVMKHYYMTNIRKHRNLQVSMLF